jgi:hypothetical protein
MEGTTRQTVGIRRSIGGIEMIKELLTILGVVVIALIIVGVFL